MVDDQLAAVLAKNAKQNGLSVSSFARLVLKEFFNKATGKKESKLLEQGLLDLARGNVEKISLADFEKELKALKDA